MSNTPLKCIVLIIKYICFENLLDCPLFAIKPPFHPRSSRCSFSECLYTKHFPKQALLDLLRRLMLRGKVNHSRGNSRHFPRGWKWRVPPEMPVEPVPLSAAGESEPFSLESPALSLGVEMPSATRGACGAGTPVGRGGKVNRFRWKVRHFPWGWKCQVPPEVPVEPVPLPAAGESEPKSRKSPALSSGVEMPSATRGACGVGTPTSRGV